MRRYSLFLCMICGFVTTKAADKLPGSLAAPFEAFKKAWRDTKCADFTQVDCSENVKEKFEVIEQQLQTYIDTTIKPMPKGGLRGLSKKNEQSLVGASAEMGATIRVMSQTQAEFFTNYKTHDSAKTELEKLKKCRELLGQLDAGFTRLKKFRSSMTGSYGDLTKTSEMKAAVRIIADEVIAYFTQVFTTAKRYENKKTLDVHFWNIGNNEQRTRENKKKFMDTVTETQGLVERNTALDQQAKTTLLNVLRMMREDIEDFYTKQQGLYTSYKPFITRPLPLPDGLKKQFTAFKDGLKEQLKKLQDAKKTLASSARDNTVQREVKKKVQEVLDVHMKNVQQMNDIATSLLKIVAGTK